MEDQQRIQQLVSETNSKPPQSLLPIYAPTVQDDNTDEWDLRQLLTVVRRRAVVIGGVAIAISATVWLWTLSLEPKYEAKFRLWLEPETVDKKLAGLTDTQNTNPNVKTALDYETQVQVLQSPEIMAPIIKQISTRYPDITYSSLLGNLTVAHIQDTQILEFSYQDVEPQKTHFVSQQLATGYLKHSQEEGQTNLRQGIKFVEDQMPQLQARVNSLQKQLQQFQQQYNFTDPAVRAQQLGQQDNAIELQRIDTQKKLGEAKTLYAAYQKQSAKLLAEITTWDYTLYDSADEGLRDPLAGASAQQLNPIYQKLLGQVQDVEIKIATESAKNPKNSSLIRELRQQKENLTKVLQKEEQRLLASKLVEVENRISLLNTRATQVSQAQSILNQQVSQLPTLTRSYTNLQRELKVATDSLNRFLEKREALQVEISQKENVLQLIATPRLPQTPISPNVKRNLLLGVIAGLLAGIGAALLAERLDKVFHSPDELKEVTKLPILGRIPFYKNLKQLAPATKATVDKNSNGYKLASPNIRKTQSDNYFPFLEAFRSLHTNINFLASDTLIHSLVISSSGHADGKSTVALQMAQIAADMGQRVLLVDADLRRPQIHTRLNLSNEQGLANVISTNLPVLDVIQQTPLSDNLFVLTSGQTPPEPTKLLSSKKMQNIMEQLRQKFDLVIYDTPPVLGLADSSLVATHTAGIVLVVRIDKTERSPLMQALEQLKLSRAAVLGVICNGVKSYDKIAYDYNYQSRTQTQN